MSLVIKRVFLSFKKKNTRIFFHEFIEVTNNAAYNFLNTNYVSKPTFKTMSTHSKSFIPFAIISGFFAALSSVFAKLFSDERTELFHAYVATQLNIVPEKVKLL